MSNYQQSTLRVIPYNPQLDGLRFCAVFFVLCYHWLAKIFTGEESYFFLGFINFFFVLSSYLITSILITSKNKGIDRSEPRLKTILLYLYRRCVRIFPAYYLYLFIILLIPVISDEINRNSAMYFAYLSNYQIYFEQAWPISAAHLWTLAVEEQYYIIWPFIVIFLPEKYIFKALFGIIILGVLLRIFYYVPPVKIPQNILTQFCIDSFAIGGLLANRYSKIENENHWLSRYFNYFFYPSIVLAVISFFLKSYYFSFVINSFVFSIISYKLIEQAIFGYSGFLGRFLQNKIVIYFGKISYGIYLYHLIIPFLFWKLFNMVYNKLNAMYPSFFSTHNKEIKLFIKIISSEICCFVIYSVITVFVAILSWNLVEKQFNKLKFIFSPVNKNSA